MPPVRHLPTGPLEVGLTTKLSGPGRYDNRPHDEIPPAAGVRCSARLGGPTAVSTTLDAETRDTSTRPGARACGADPSDGHRSNHGDTSITDEVGHSTRIPGANCCYGRLT